MCIEYLFERKYGISPPKSTGEISSFELELILAAELPNAKRYISDNKKKVAPFTEYERMINHSIVDVNSYIKEYYDCIGKDTPIICKKDDKVTIKEIQDLDNTYNVLNHNNEWTGVNWVREKTTENNILSKTSKGTITLTDDHKVIFDGKYEEFKDVDYPDTIRIDTKFDSKNTITPELAWVYGLFFSDGHCKHYPPKKTQNHKYVWKISNCNYKLLEKANKILGDKFKIVTFPSEMEGISRGGVQAKNTLHNLIYSNGYGKTKNIVSEWQDKFYSNSYNKKLPDEVLNGNTEIAKMFLNGVYDGDGTKNKTPINTITINSRIGLLGLQVILEKLGLDYYVKPEPRRKNTWYIKYGMKFRQNKLMKKNKDIQIDNIPVYDINTDSGNLIASNCKIKNCDDYSFQLMGDFHIPKWSALAFGILWLDKPAHAVNLFVDDNREVWIVEPQDDKIFKLPKDWKERMLIM